MSIRTSSWTHSPCAAGCWSPTWRTPPSPQTRGAPARELLAVLPEPARDLPSERVARAYTTAVLGPDETAEEDYATALAALPADWALTRAGLHLHHGRRLRRRRRNVDARRPLRLDRGDFQRTGCRSRRRKHQFEAADAP
ncbi:hypothetical protein [Streptomyces sp. AC627_RSS907]|uniref:hypothetical protein n=1 Tax=Streptomyces sp. AC627_RSS907 TaxID=2823684 RepID=UPI0027E4EA55|nr:hypothetical protein [Streptomyces sp. AC627_RSS907]